MTNLYELQTKWNAGVVGGEQLLWVQSFHFQDKSSGDVVSIDTTVSTYFNTTDLTLLKG